MTRVTDGFGLLYVIYIHTGTTTTITNKQAFIPLSGVRYIDPPLLLDSIFYYIFIYI